MTMARFANIAILVAVGCSSVTDTSAFTQPARSHRMKTSLNLEDDIANMIDKEAERLNDMLSWRQNEEAKRKKGNDASLPQGFDFNSVSDFTPAASAAAKIQARKDRRMARDSPERYCADRCVATGNCDIWEDMFELSEKEVQKFCKDCVLSEGEEPCEVPEKFFEDAGMNSWEKGGLQP